MTEISQNGKEINELNGNMAFPSTLSKLSVLSSPVAYLNGDNGYHYGYVKNKYMVFLKLNVVITNASGWGSDPIANNLPIPIFLDGISFSIHSDMGSSGATAHVNHKGELQIAGGENGKYYVGSLIYPIK